MDVLIEPSEYRFLNAGDSAMMQVAMKRLCAMWPQARMHVFTDYPDLLPRYSEQILPISNAGRALWLAEGLMRLSSWRRSLYLRSPRVSTLLRHLRYSSNDPRDRHSVETFLNLMRSANVFVIAGMGGITSAFTEYAEMVLNTLGLAQAYGVPTVLLGQGLGPFDSELDELSRQVLRRVAYIALREGLHGPALLRKWGLKDEQWAVTGDDAIELAFQNRPATIGNAIGINIRIADYSGVSGDVVDELRAPLQEITRTLSAPLRVIPISRLPEEDDASCAEAVIAGYPDVAPTHNVADGSIGVIREIQQCRIVVTGSYHAGVFALAQGIPVVGLFANDYYRWKFEGLAHQFGEGCCILQLGTPNVMVELRRMLGHLWLNAPRLRTELLRSAQRQQEAGTAAYAHVSHLVASRSGECAQCASR